LLEIGIKRKKKKMLPDEMESEKNRKIIVAQANKIKILENNVRELQQQLTAAYIKMQRLSKNE
jgi:hypothetical protein